MIPVCSINSSRVTGADSDSLPPAGVTRTARARLHSCGDGQIDEGHWIQHGNRHGEQLQATVEPLPLARASTIDSDRRDCQKCRPSSLASLHRRLRPRQAGPLAIR